MLSPWKTAFFALAFLLAGGVEMGEAQTPDNKEAAQVSAALLAEGKLDEAELVLEKAALDPRTGSSLDWSNPTVRNFAAFLLLRGTIDKKIAQLTPPAGQVLQKRRAEVLLYLHRAKGDLPSALRVAEQAGDRSLEKWLLWEQGHWKALLEQPVLQADPKGPADIDGLGFRAAYARLAGQTKEFDKTLAEIRLFADARKADSADSWFAAKALFLNDRPQDAVDVLIRAKRYGSAFEILKLQKRYREAFAIADKVKGEKHEELFFLESQRATTLYEVGEKQKALALIAQLGDHIKDASSDYWSHMELVRCEVELGLKDQAFAHVAALFKDGGQNANAAWLFDRLFPDKGKTAEAWWNFLRQRYVAEDFPAALKRLRAVMEGTLDNKEFVALAGAAATWALETRELNTEEREQRLHAVAEASLAAGQEKLAQRYFEEAVEVAGGTAALIRLADFLATKKQWQSAAGLYGQAARQDAQAPLPLFLQGRALVQAGRKDEGEKLMQLAHWLPMAREDARYELAEALRKRGLKEDALREWDILARTGGLHSIYQSIALQPLATAAAAQGKYLKAADLRELFMLPCLATNTAFGQTSAYLSVPHRVHRDRARGLLAAGKTDAALIEIQTCLRFFPADVDTPILFAPLLEKAGRKKDADELYAKVFTDWEQHCTDYPRWAHAHNRLAELGGRCRRQLDTALTHGQKAVELEPKSAAYLATLAEVHFQRGDQARAIELMRRCIDIDPQRDFFQQQLQRYRDGDRLVDVPSE